MARWLGPLLLIAVAAGSVCAQPSPFVPIDADGAPAHSTVTALAVGPAGFLWVGTDRGLLRYDGVAFVDASVGEGSIPADTVTSLLTDRFETMWVGTRSSGLFRYDARARSFAAALPAGGASEEVTSLVADSAGRIWVGTADAGALRYNPADGAVDRYGHDPLAPVSLGSPAVVDVAVDPAGRVLVASADRGLSVVHPDGRVIVHRAYAPGGLPSDALAALAVDAAGQVVVADRSGGVGRFDPATGVYEPVAGALTPGVPATLLETTDDGALWVGRRDGRLVRIADGAAAEYVAPAPVVSLARDGSGVVWAGTYAAGLARFDPRSRLFERALVSAPGGRRRLVTSVTEGPGGTIWVGVDAEGLVALDPGSGATIPVDPGRALPRAPVVLDVHAAPDGLDLALGFAGHARVRAVFASSDASRGAATAEGGSALRLERVGTASTPSAELPPVTSVLRDGERLLLGTAGWGVVVTRPGAEPVRHDLGGASVHAIEPAGEGRFWVGTGTAALVLLSPERGVVERVELAEHPTPDDAVWTIDAQPDGSLWVAARESGVVRYAPGVGVTARLRPGLDFDAAAVRGAVSDPGGGVWFTTSDGLYRLDERTGRLDRYSAADGTGTDDYSAKAIVRASDGTIYAGGPNGVVRFDPRRLRPSDYRPPVVIAAVSVAGVPLSWADLTPAAGARSHDPRLLTIRHGTPFTVTAASLDFSDPGSLRYAHRLVATGARRSRAADWVETGGERTFSFSGLDPGTYRLYVRGTNGDGVPAAHPAVLDVVVEPAWWRTPAAFTLYAISAVVVVTVFAGWVRARRALAGIDARISPR